MLWKVPSVWTVPNLDQCNISTGILPIYTVNWEGAILKYLAKRSLRAFRHSETWFNPVLFTFSFGMCTHYCGRNPRTNRRCKILCSCVMCVLTTVYPKKYAHGFVVLCFVVVIQSFIMNSHEIFIHIHQGCFAGTGAIVRLPQCQWSKPDGCGKISQCITTTKYSKAKTVCIFLGIYCIGRTNLAQRQPGFIVCMRPTNGRRRYTVTTVTSLHCNVVSHWLGANTPWALQQHLIILTMVISRMLKQWRFPILNQWSNTMRICGIGDSF